MKEKNIWRFRAKLAVSICLICAIAVAASPTYNAGILRLIDNLGVMRWLHDPADGSLSGFDSTGLVETVSLDSATGNVTADGTVTAAEFVGGGAGITGEIGDSRLSGNVALLNTPQTWSEHQTFTKFSVGTPAMTIEGGFAGVFLKKDSPGVFDIEVGSASGNISEVRIGRNTGFSNGGNQWGWYAGTDLGGPARVLIDGTAGTVYAIGGFSGSNVTVSGRMQAGGVVKGFEDITGAGETLTTSDYYFQLNPSTGNQTVTLPTGAPIGTEFRGCILNGHATNTVSFDAGTDNIHAPSFFAATPYTLPDSTAHRWIMITRISATVWSIDTGLSN